MLTVPLFKAVTTLDKLHKTKCGRKHLAHTLCNPLRVKIDYTKILLGYLNSQEIEKLLQPYDVTDKVLD